MHAMGAECLCEYVAMTRLIVIPAPLWRVNMSTRFKTLNDISDVAVECGIVNKLFIIYTIDIQIQVFVYKFQCLTKMEFPLCFPSALWL